MRGYLLIISALCIWSTWGLAVRWVEKPVEVIVFYNALFAAFFQGGWFLLFGKKGFSLALGRDLGAVLLIGVCGLVNVYTFFYAIKATTVAAALLTHYTAPVFVAVIAPFVLKDRMGKGTLAALFVSAMGLVLIFSKGLGGTGPQGLMGAAAGTVSGVAYAFIIILSRAVSRRQYPLAIAFVQAALGAAVMAFVALPSGQAGLTLGQGAVLAGVGLLHSTIAIVIYLIGIREVTAQEAGVLGYLEPVFGILLAYLFLGETPHPYAVAGGLMIMFSGAAVVMSYGRAGLAGGADDNRG